MERNLLAEVLALVEAATGGQPPIGRFTGTVLDRFSAGAYRLGPAAPLPRAPGPAWLRDAARAPMSELAAAIPGATINLVVPVGQRTLIADTLEGEPTHLVPMRRGMIIGRHTEPDWLWAAHRPDGEPPTGVPVREWRRAVKRVRENGGVLYSPETTCSAEVGLVGVPVHRPDGTVVGSLGAMVVDHRLSRVEPLVRQAARMVTAALTRSAR